MINRVMVGTEELRKLLRQDVAKIGGQAAWARKHGVSEQYVSEILNRQRDISAMIAACLGYERRWMYLKAGRAGPKAP